MGQIKIFHCYVYLIELNRMRADETENCFPFCVTFYAHPVLMHRSFHHCIQLICITACIF